MLDFPLSRRLPALDEIDSKPRIGGIEGQVTDKPKPMVNFACVIFTIIIGHPTGSLGLSHLLEQKRVAFYMA